MCHLQRSDELGLDFTPNTSNNSDGSLLEQSAETSHDEEYGSIERTSAAASVKDHGWAWVICGAAFLDLFIVLGMHYSFGVLYTALLDHFGESKATTGTYENMATRRFPSCISPLFRSESWCEVFNMEIISICKGFALGLALKQRRNSTWKSTSYYSLELTYCESIKKV